MITDEHLLAACRSADEPGSQSWHMAYLLYREAVSEWRERDQAARQERASRITDLAEIERRDALGKYPRPVPEPARCGTVRGYKQHIRRHTRTCKKCRKAWNAYCQDTRRHRADAAVTARAARRELRTIVLAAHKAGTLTLGTGGAAWWAAA